MKALITGASSGLGAEFARQLSHMGYDIIAVARRKERLEALASQLVTKVTVYVCDLAESEQCQALFDNFRFDDIDILINNAGFGQLGFFTDTSLEKELSMLDVNCRAVHILTKLFLQKFTSDNKGKILNVCSIGAYLPGPLLASYYATKAYVKSLTLGISEELRRQKSNVYIGCLCPGPVSTEFSEVAGAKNALQAAKPEFIVRYALRKIRSNKTVIIPRFEVKITALAAKLLPERFMANLSFNVQKKKL